ncbi:MAG: methionyl-tRNA formyltransferase [Oscillospiraceae bacterium]|nr:methionyl-tRNA formyltransferase [Oscillospiraceae bacterium]
MRILFMGTPSFAVASLRRLVEDGHEVCGVFTQPDRPKNRGHKMMPPPVKEYALSVGLPVYQPEKMRDGTALSLVQQLQPELIVVAAYGRILPREILEAPALGAINVHSSILPKYRGAAPINWAILNGEAVTGVTIMYMAEGMDTGDIILCRETEIGPEEDAQELTVRLAELGADALREAMVQLSAGTVVRIPQNGENATYAPMLTRELSDIDWTRGARQIHDQVRGLIPWPCAKTDLLGKTVKVFRTTVGGPTSAEPGAVLSLGKQGIEIACGDGWSIVITELQPDGGKRMSAAAYLAGHPVKTGL